MTLYMETTTVGAERTASEVQRILMNAGANRILYDYTDKKISGLSFILPIHGVEIPFTLPVRVQSIYLLLQKKRPTTTRHKKQEQDLEAAYRIAWRQLLRWIQAQFAMIDTGMVEAGEILMPYIQVKGGKTMWESVVAGGLKRLALPASGGENDKNG